MEYIDRFNPQFEVKPSASGDGTEPEFNYNSDGELVCTGRVNVQEIIQSQKEECDLGYLINKFVNGDTAALSQRVGQYIDVTDLPSSLAEAFEAGENGAAAYAALSDEQKSMLKDGKSEEFIKSFSPTAEDEKVALLKRLSELTGKEVKIDE